MIVIRGSFVQPEGHTVTLLTDHLLLVDDDGFISHFSSFSEPASSALATRHAAQLVSLPRAAFILPGFVDTHCAHPLILQMPNDVDKVKVHAPQYCNAGRALDRPLMDWLDHYTFPSERTIDQDPALAQLVYSKLVDRLLQHGTTAVSFFGTIGIEANLTLARICQEKGLRGMIGRINMDINSPPDYSETTQQSLSNTREFIQRMRQLVEHLSSHQKFVEPVITPRFVPTCSGELLKGLSEIAKQEQCRVQSHLSESADQVAFSRSLWNGKDDIEVFQEYGLLGPKTLMAHCTHSHSQLPVLASTKTSIAHCPLSNIYFSPERTFPLVEAWQHGIEVGLGSDISGGYRISLEEQMRQAVNVSKLRTQETVSGNDKTKGISWKQSIYLATRGGAKAIGIESGRFEIGRPFDAQLIQLGRPDSQVDLFDNFRQETLEDMVERWWCNGAAVDRTTVWVQGVKVR